MKKLTEMDLPKLPGYINITEAGQRLGQTRQWVYKQCQRDFFKSLVQVGNQPVFLIGEDEINALVGSRLPDPEPELLHLAS